MLGAMALVGLFYCLKQWKRSRRDEQSSEEPLGIGGGA